MDSTQPYTTRGASERTLLLLLLVIMWIAFGTLYFVRYVQNPKSFIVPERLLEYRVRGDSVDLVRQIRLAEEQYARMNHYKSSLRLEFSVFSQIKLAEVSGDMAALIKPRYLSDTTELIVVPSIFSPSQGDTIAHVLYKDGSPRYSVCIDLYRGPPSPPQKYFGRGSAEPSTLKETLRAVLSSLENELEDIRVECDNAQARLKALNEELDGVKNAVRLGYFDFLIYSANMHVSFNSDGIIPGTSSMRFFCVVHRSVVLVLSYLLALAHWKRKD